MHSLVALVVLLACIHVCTVHGDIVLSKEAQDAFMDTCTKLSSDKALCERGLKALKTLDKDPNGYLNTMGFYVPGYQGNFEAVFWSSFELGPKMSSTLGELAKIDSSLWSSFNILPGAVANDLYGNKDFPDTVFTVPQFWLPFSTWMAKNSQQLVLYVSGSAKEFFPLTPTTIFETHELPYLDPPRVKQLVALHLPPPNTNPIKCKDDKVSFNHLEKVKSTLNYYCCNLPTFVSADKSAKDIKTVAKEVTDAIKQGTCVPVGSALCLGLG